MLLNNESTSVRGRRARRPLGLRGRRAQARRRHRWHVGAHRALLCEHALLLRCGELLALLLEDALTTATKKNNCQCCILLLPVLRTKQAVLSSYSIAWHYSQSSSIATELHSTWSCPFYRIRKSCECSADRRVDKECCSSATRLTTLVHCQELQSALCLYFVHDTSHRRSKSC